MKKTYIDKLGLILIKDKKVLVTLTCGQNSWYMPGGKREGDETDKEALLREIKEELSADLEPESIKHYGTFEAQAHGKPKGTIVRITAYTGSVKGDLKPAAEIEKIEFFPYHRRSEVSTVGQLIFDNLKKKRLMD